MRSSSRRCCPWRRSASTSRIPKVYGLAAERLALEREQVCFLSSNAWDAHAAKAFGYRVLWCNRFGQAPERIPERPDGEIATLAALPGIVTP